MKKTVTAFLDWDCASRIDKKHEISTKTPLEKMARIYQSKLNMVSEKITKALLKINAQNYYRVQLRLYDGWYQGTTKTLRRNALERVYPAEIHHKQVSFIHTLEYNDYLLCASNLASKEEYKLTNTYRKDLSTEEWSQKIIDTSIVCDILHFIKVNQNSLALLVGDDDDLWPGVLVGFSWGGDVKVLRVNRNDEGSSFPYINKHIIKL